MKSLTLETTQDHPSSLRSSQELPVETSIEDIIFSSNNFTEHSIQMDAAPGENLLRQKLDGEYKYHKYGSRMDQQESQHASGSRLDPLREERNRRVSNNPSYEKASTGESAARNKEVPERERYLGLSSPEEPKVFPNTSDTSQKTEVKAQPFNYPGMYNSPGTVGPVPGSLYPYGMGAPFPYNPGFQRMNSLPAGFPVPESDATQGMPFSPITLYPPQDKGTGNWIINNASGVQIGNYNHLSIGNQTISSEPCQSSPQSNNCPVEMIQMFENNPVEEEHLQLLRDNLGKNWKHCARKLGIREPEIEVIDHDYERDGLKEKVYQMLEMWKMREGQRGTTVGKLLRALQDSKGDLLNKLLQLCKNMQSP